jgi:type IV conjugative transfer system coupling protein TraD
MLNNFISGGQVFLHKIRMLRQVLSTAFVISILAGALIAWNFSKESTSSVDWGGAATYAKAKVSITLHPALSAISIGKSKANVDAYSNGKLWKKRMLASSVISSSKFSSAWNKSLNIIQILSLKAISFGACTSIVIFLFWSRFGRSLKDEKKKDGSGEILTPEQVARKLKSLRLASDFKIGKMPLVKDMETMNFLVSGSIGSGKTNLMHNLLPQIEDKKQPAVVIDNTGEMIAKYYNKERGDIIFNPFDDRSHVWDFWKDCTKSKDLEKFADILIGFNSRKNHREANDFWEEGAQSIFVDTTKKMQQRAEHSIEELYRTLCQTENKDMYRMLQNTNSAKHFAKDNEKVAASIMSVLMSNIKPLRFAQDSGKNDKFSIEEYLKKINAGGSSWLFLSTDPSARELTAPLNAALLELLISRMRRTRTNSNNKLWIVMDELPSLGKLPSLAQLMAEGRKYGSCVLAGLQSTSQLYSHYGDAGASSLIGSFKTKFAFQSDDPKMGELYSKLCGTSTVISQQKNTSFGANEFRDGVSYNEKKEKSPLASYEEFGKLNVGECYTILPLTSVRLSKMQVPQANLADKNDWFDEAPEITLVDNQLYNKEELAIENIGDLTLEPPKEELVLEGLQQKPLKKVPKKEIINRSKDSGLDNPEL